MSFSFSQFQDRLFKAHAHVMSEVAKLRTGRASVQLLDPVVVEAYGTKMGLNELAKISAPSHDLLTIVPWDKSQLSAIEKAITSSGLNLNPVVDGDAIRIAIPPLTQERRQEMVKLLHQRIEEGKAMLRSVRTETKKEVDAQSGAEGVSEDDIARDLQQMEDIFKQAMLKIDQVLTEKQAELMKV